MLNRLNPRVAVEASLQHAQWDPQGTRRVQVLLVVGRVLQACRLLKWLMHGLCQNPKELLGR